VPTIQGEGLRGYSRGQRAGGGRIRESGGYKEKKGFW